MFIVLWALVVILGLSYAGLYSRHGTLLLRVIMHLLFGLLAGALSIMLIYLIWNTPRPADFNIHIVFTLSFSVGIAISTHFTNHLHIIFKIFWNTLSCVICGMTSMVLFWVYALATTSQDLSGEEVILVTVTLATCSLALGMGVAIFNQIGRFRSVRRKKKHMKTGHGIPWPMRQDPYQPDPKKKTGQSTSRAISIRLSLNSTR